jgi:regulator of sirC expression with transglutaminase-like and TPR domain
MRELWSPRDDADVSAFVSAAEWGDLFTALLRLEGAPQSARAAATRLLDAWALRVEGRCGASAPAARVNARGLATVLASEEGLRGEPNDYYSPENCLLHAVLKRRRGMPILLSAIWIEVGRRAGIAVEGVGLPGHFIVRVGPEPGVLMDPYAGGLVLSMADCKRKVEEMASGRLVWRPEFLRAAPTCVIAERVLHNLAGCYARAGDEAGRFRVLTFLAALRPDEPENLFSRAESADALGVRDLAMRVYGEILERFPDSSQAQAVAERLRGAGAEPVN